MDWLASLSLFTLSLFLTLLLRSKLKTPPTKRPPGPPAWPVIGNIFDLGSQPHRDFARLKSTYGPVIWLKLGNLNAVVVQSAAAAAELFKKHDLAFADRKSPNSMTACGYIEGSMAQAPYNESWRILRRLAASELMVGKRVNSSLELREKCVDKMIGWIKEDSLESKGKSIQLDKYLLIMSFNLMSNFMLSRDVMDLKSEMGDEFLEVMHEFISWQAKPNVVDAFEFLRWLDPQGIRRRTEKNLQKLLNLVSVFVKERIEERELGREKGKRDFLDALLEYEGVGGNERLTEKNINILILEMFFGGTETTSNTTAWAMAELLRNPKTMQKLKSEIDQIIGVSEPVKEDDLNKLPYLRAVAEETMRLHPALPLLLPRSTRHDTVFMGYHIPKDAAVFVNAWAIHRDPESWEDPLSFKPERFLNSRDSDRKGQDFEMIPFGSGRRSCVGMLIGERMVSLSLARLVQCFDWELPAGVSPETVDMREMFGISLRMLTPLKAVPTYRGGE